MYNKTSGTEQYVNYTIRHGFKGVADKSKWWVNSSQVNKVWQNTSKANASWNERVWIGENWHNDSIRSTDSGWTNHSENFKKDTLLIQSVKKYTHENKSRKGYGWTNLTWIIPPWTNSTQKRKMGPVNRQQQSLE